MTAGSSIRAIWILNSLDAVIFSRRFPVVEKRWRGACKIEEEKGNDGGIDETVFSLLLGDSELAAAFADRKRREHWILTVLWENEIYILDSLSRPHPYRQWENIVISVVKQFNAETGRTGKPRVTRLHGVVEQVGGVECGYCVMQFMKEIVNDETLSFPTKWVGKKRKPYDQSKIDEVRLEVADYIQALL